MVKERKCGAVQRLVVGLLVVVVLALAGCSRLGIRSLQSTGLPDDKYIVGGGMMIDWEADTAGTAYLVEKTTGKIVETRSLARGDRFSFSIASGPQLQAFEKMLGIDMAEARLLLYFEPNIKPGKDQ